MGSSSVTGDETILFADNMSFDGTHRAGKMTLNGQLWIGSTSSDRANNGGHVRLGSLTSPGGTLTIGYSSPNITLDLAGGSAAIERVALQSGTSPILPSGGTITFNGAVVAAGTNPVRTDGTGANTMALEVQTSQALAAADATKIGLSNFDSSSFAVDSTGFVTLSTTGAGKTITGDSGPALSPIDNNWFIGGSYITASAYPVQTSGFGNTLTVKVQLSSAFASSDPTFAGLASFDSSQFAVDANGFVQIISGGFPWTDISGAFSPLKENGYFIIGTATGTLPDTPSQGDTIKFVVDHASQLLTIAASGSQIIRFGTIVTSAGGTAVSTQIGDSCELVYRAADTCWFAINFVGTWVLT